MENVSAFTRSFPSKEERIALCSALILSSVLIIAGNLLTLVLFAVTKPLRRKSLFLVMNMAFADLMLGAFTLPFYIFVVGGFDGIFLLGSYIFAASISCERFYAVFWPFKLPLSILNILSCITRTSIPWKFYYMVNILSYSNSFVNPIVYVFRIPEFQQALRSCYTKRRPAIKMVKTERRNRKVAPITPETQLRILRNDPSHLQVEVEQEDIRKLSFSQLR